MLTKRGVSILSSTLGLVAASSIAFDGLFSTVTLFILSIFVVESILYLISLRGIDNISVERKVSLGTAFVGDEFSIETEIINKGKRKTGPVLITEKIPYGYRVTDRNDKWFDGLMSGERYLMNHSLKALQMGDWNLGDIEILIIDRFGMFKKAKILKVEARVSVYPSMRKGEEILRGRIHLGLKPLRRSSVITPQGSEFSGIRVYSPGDDYRLIAWKTMAKSPIQAPKTKEHENEQALNVTFVILNSETSGDGLVGKRKLDAIAETSIVLSHLAIRTGGEFNVVYWKGGKAELAQGRPLEIASKVFNLVPEADLDMDSILNFAINASKPRSLILAILDAPYPMSIDPTIFRRAIIRQHFIHVLLLDTVSFFDYVGDEEIRRCAWKITSDREHSHLNELTVLLASNSISSQTCSQVTLLPRVLDTFSRSSVVLET